MQVCQYNSTHLGHSDSCLSPTSLSPPASHILGIYYQVQAGRQVINATMAPSLAIIACAAWYSLPSIMFLGTICLTPQLVHVEPGTINPKHLIRGMTSIISK